MPVWFIVCCVNVVVDVWQPLQSRLVGFGMCPAVGSVTMLTPYQLMPVAWHVAHVMPATGVWFIAVPLKLVNVVAE